jgi:hypothetical protein
MLKNKKYLFVWEGVLTDYTSGMVCVFAKNEKDAWDLLKKKDLYAWASLGGENLDKAIKPCKVTKSEAFVVWGGG